MNFLWIEPAKLLSKCLSLHFRLLFEISNNMKIKIINNFQNGELQSSKSNLLPNGCDENLKSFRCQEASIRFSHESLYQVYIQIKKYLYSFLLSNMC